MSRKRMTFSAAVCTSKKFVSLSQDAQALYYRLAFEADSHGFVADAEGVAGIARVDVSAVSELVDTRFLYEIDGVHLIVDWWRNVSDDRRTVGRSSYDHLLRRFDLDESNRYVPSCN